MPNWCINKVTVVGPRDDVNNFLSRLEYSKNRACECNNWELEQFARDLCYNSYYVNNVFQSRGTFNRIRKPKQVGEEVAVEFEIESAWTPVYETFDIILKDHFPTLREYTLAEEPGMAIYVNTDTEGVFYDTRFKVSIYIDGNEHVKYFSDSSKAYNFLVEHLNKPALAAFKRHTNAGKDWTEFSYRKELKNGQYNYARIYEFTNQ